MQDAFRPPSVVRFGLPFIIALLAACGGGSVTPGEPVEDPALPPPIEGFARPGPDLEPLVLPAPLDSEIRITDRSHLLVDGADLVGVKLFFVRCHDVWVRNTRIDYAGLPGATGDGLAFTACTNIVVSHCVLQGATDECLDLWNCANATVQFNVLGPGATSGHDKGVDHSSGLICGGGTRDVSVHHNLFLGNRQRNPICYGDSQAGFHPLSDVRNNLVYDCYGGTQIGFGADANVVANLYLAPRRDLPIKLINDPYDTTGSVFLAGNVVLPSMALLQSDASTSIAPSALPAPTIEQQDAYAAAVRVLLWVGPTNRSADEQARLDAIAADLSRLSRP